MDFEGFCDGYIRYSFFMLKKNKIPETHQCKSDRDPEHFPFFLEGNQINEQCKTVIFFWKFSCKKMGAIVFLVG